MPKRLLTTMTVAFLTACGGDTQDASDEGDGGPTGKGDDPDALESAVCLQQSTRGDVILAAQLADIPGALDQGGIPVIANYTAWPVYDPSTQTAQIDPQVVRQISDPEEARANLAARYGDCSDDVEDHLTTAKPNIYIYFRTTVSSIRPRSCAGSTCGIPMP
jgi:hypothetical protein